MTNNTGNTPATAETGNWQLTALTEALGDLTLTVNDSLSIGRGSDNDVVLGSKQVSRNHALLSVLNDKLYVKDLNSSNGTFINDERINANESKHVTTGDTLGFASFSFQVSAPVKEHVQSTVSASKIEAPVTKETGITDILSAAENTAPVSNELDSMSTDTPDSTNVPAEQDMLQPSVMSTPVESAPTAATTLAETELHETVAPVSTHHEPVVEQTAFHDEPVKADEVVSHESPVADPAIEAAHDKTTKTALQEEADPDVLRAKQAATAQFSGTANLGQPRDVGTTGNNAMDQALDNPATGAVEKKPSGSWFIWVFIAIIIIGLALWLFNTGMV